MLQIVAASLRCLLLRTKVKVAPVPVAVPDVGAANHEVVLTVGSDLIICGGGAGASVVSTFGEELHQRSLRSQVVRSDQDRVTTGHLASIGQGQCVRLSAVAFRTTTGEKKLDVHFIPCVQSDILPELCVVQLSPADRVRAPPPLAPIVPADPGGRVQNATSLSRSVSWSLSSNGSPVPVPAAENPRDQSDVSLTYSISGELPDEQNLLRNPKSFIDAEVQTGPETEGCSSSRRPPLPPEAQEAARAFALLSASSKRMGSLLEGAWTLISDHEENAEEWLLRLFFRRKHCTDNEGKKWSLERVQEELCLRGGRLALEGENLLHWHEAEGERRRFSFTRGDGGRETGKPLVKLHADSITERFSSPSSPSSPSSSQDNIISVASPLSSDDLFVACFESERES